MFSDYFKNWKIKLPEDACRNRAPGVIKSHGWEIKYIFGEDEKGKYLDFYACHRMTNERHERIYSTGEIVSLNAPEEFIVYPKGATEEEKAQIRRQHEEYNQKVYMEITSKFKNL